jgi:hypothetical protein
LQKSARKNEDEFHKKAEFSADLRTCKKDHAKKVIDRQVKEKYSNHIKM